MKPTVSESSTLGRVSSSKSRVVESSVANRRSSTNNPEFVRAFMIVDFPAFV